MTGKGEEKEWQALTNNFHLHCKSEFHRKDTNQEVGSGGSGDKWKQAQ